MQYYGNLALREEKKAAQPAPRRQSHQAPRPRRRSIPVGEKLLYLLTVIVFVALASLVVYRYATLYQLNREIQTTSSQYEQEIEKSKDMQQEIDKLKDPSRIKEMATSFGLEPLETQPITLKASSDPSAAAKK